MTASVAALASVRASRLTGALPKGARTSRAAAGRGSEHPCGPAGFQLSVTDRSEDEAVTIGGWAQDPVSAGLQFGQVPRLRPGGLRSMGRRHTGPGVIPRRTAPEEVTHGRGPARHRGLFIFARPETDSSGLPSPGAFYTEIGADVHRPRDWDMRGRVEQLSGKSGRLRRWRPFAP